MLQELDQIEQQARETLESLNDESSLEEWRVAHLGRSAPLMLVFEQLGKLSKEDYEELRNKYSNLYVQPSFISENTFFVASTALLNILSGASIISSLL